MAVGPDAELPAVVPEHRAAATILEVDHLGEPVPVDPKHLLGSVQRPGVEPALALAVLELGDPHTIGLPRAALGAPVCVDEPLAVGPVGGR